MTVKEFLDSVNKSGMIAKGTEKSIADVMAEATDIWSNGACKGYCIKAMKTAGLTEKQITGVMAALAAALDDTTVSEAEDLYNQSNY